MLGPRVSYSRRMETLKKSSLLKTFHPPRVWHAGSQHRYHINNISITTNRGVSFLYHNFVMPHVLAGSNFYTLVFCVDIIYAWTKQLTSGLCPFIQLLNHTSGQLSMRSTQCVMLFEYCRRPHVSPTKQYCNWEKN